jgi:hypothetical protein
MILVAGGQTAYFHSYSVPGEDAPPAVLVRLGIRRVLDGEDPRYWWERLLDAGEIKRDWVPQLETIVWAAMVAGNLIGAVYAYKHFGPPPGH